VRLILIIFQLYLPACHSLKDKRRIIKSIKDKVKARFNVSIAEVNYHETWQRSSLAIAWVASDGSGIDRIIDALDKLIQSYCELQILKMERIEY